MDFKVRLAQGRYWYIFSGVLFISFGYSIVNIFYALTPIPYAVFIFISLPFLVKSIKDMKKSYTLHWDEENLRFGETSIHTEHIEKIWFYSPLSFYVYRNDAGWLKGILHFQCDKDRYPAIKKELSAWAENRGITIKH
ncbi:hypothetical protein [Paenibacillus paeoniae]|uniref:YcxB family protein n=1 Tax=Paenibacillus paeoniae TaxID=2292705 RepID=A0A371PLC4_9BACL|nr:hypothetical protein [Paenibacillus paeoniae]REK77006.1 hypothetical protein DX130_08345 [Paenibacillus paeoniae]